MRISRICHQNKISKNVQVIWGTKNILFYAKKKSSKASEIKSLFSKIKESLSNSPKGEKIAKQLTGKTVVSRENLRNEMRDVNTSTAKTECVAV
jgi:hypothetical protein